MQVRMVRGQRSGFAGAPVQRGRRPYARVVFLAVLLALAGFALQPGSQAVQAVNQPQYAISTGNGSGQSAQINHAFTTQLSAVVVQSGNFGQTVPGITVTFTAPASGASGTFADTGTNTTTAVTNGTGLATAPVLTSQWHGGPLYRHGVSHKRDVQLLF